MWNVPSAAVWAPWPPRTAAGLDAAPRRSRRIPISRRIRTRAAATGCPFSSVTRPEMLAAFRSARLAGGTEGTAALIPAIDAVRYPSLAASTE